MNIRQIRIALWSAAGVFGFGGLLAVALAAGLPLDGVDDSNSSGPTRRAGRSVPQSAGAAEPDLWAIELRKPLVDAPAPAPSESPSTFTPVAMPALRVVGTVVEPDHCFALIDTGAGTQFKSVGDVVNGMRIESISDAGCVVSFNGRKSSVAIEKSNSPSVAGPAPSAGPYGDH